MGDVEIPIWLKGLPLAPVYHPTDTEFADPVAYISKIEKEASTFGICKVIPPYPKPSKKYVFSNLNKSLSKFPKSGSHQNSTVVCTSSQTGSGDKGNDGEVRAVFTTRHQELGHGLKRTKGPFPIQQSSIHKQVWESGELYTLEQFESKSKAFAKSQLGMIKEVTPLVVEALFWKAASEKPIYIEYANDVPGSGFGEPEDPLQNIHKRRRKRKFNQKCRGSSNCEKHELDTLMNSHFDIKKDVSLKNHPDPSFEVCKKSPILSNLLSDEGSRSWRQKSLNAGIDKEGTAGWKLSNSPWNLQVISRSPGSLTRFMLDDIPGVTSPMIYIGMLFSWFAWHVEDHELHSLNFLHHGSPKTWYAVPGEYAFTFEEVIRSQGYGGSLDRLAALTLLGEKTNLLSPEIVVASGIPCCRLIQNPGEFVVTFPRAYHVGFSHGFNCGEAANFGTPQWLKVAKEAAVRRAAMNYLPMLSHQQLLYMLTMSFISRVPRALLPGARSSRLRDRQKEERELLVKKAFIDDMLNEKNILSVLLGKESTFYAVLWDPESLPSPRKDSQSFPSANLDASCLLVDGRDVGIPHSEKEKLCENHVLNEAYNVSTISIGRTSSVDSENDDRCNNHVDPTSLCMEIVGDLYADDDDDDLPCGLHVDSGTLACVACGILGFPFMSIVQPSQRASEEFFPVDCEVVQDELGVLKSAKPCTPSGLDGSIMKSASDTQGDCDINQKCKLSARCNSCNPMTDAPNCGRDVMLMDVSLEKSFTDAASSSSEAAETTELKDSTSRQCPVKASSSVELNQSHSADTQGPKDLQLYPTSKVDKKWNISNGFLRPRIFCLEHALEIEKLLHSKGGANVLIICHSAYPKIKAHALAVAEEVGVPFSCDDVPLENASKEDLDLINISIDDEECGEDWTSRLGINLHYRVKLRKLYSSKQEHNVLALGGLFSDMIPDSDVLSLKWNSKRSRTINKATGPNQYKLFENTQIKKGSENTQIKKGDMLVGKSEKNKVAGETKIIHYLRRSCNRKTDSSSQATSRLRGRPKKHPTNEACGNGLGDNNRIISEDAFCSVENTRNNSAELPIIENFEMQHNWTTEETRERSNVPDPAKFACSHAIENIENYSVESASFPTVESPEMQHETQTIGETRVTSKVSDHAHFLGPFVTESTGNDSVELENIPTVDNSEKQDKVWMTEETKEVSESSDCAKSVGSVSIAIPVVTSFEAQIESQTVDETDTKDRDHNFVMVDSSEIQDKMRTMDETTDFSKGSGFPKSHVSLDPVISTTGGSEAQSENKTTEEICMENKACDNMALDTSEVQQVNQTANGANEETRVCNSVKLINQFLDTVPLTTGSSAARIESRTEKTCMENRACNDELDNSKFQQENQTANGANEDARICNSMNLIGQPILPVSMVESSEEQDIRAMEEASIGAVVCSSAQVTMELENAHPIPPDSKPTRRDRNKRKRELELITEDQNSCNGFIRSPCEGLRPRTGRSAAGETGTQTSTTVDIAIKKARNTPNVLVTCKEKKEDMNGVHVCDIEGCRMSFRTRAELVMHKRNRCTHEGCGKRFSSHRYAMLHQRVHADERPFKCSWKGCKMSFKWAWARTEHLRVHTGERPYQCKVDGCGLTFRFVSDFSRHRRKTGHYVNLP